MHSFGRGVRLFAVLLLLSFEFQVFGQSAPKQSFPWSNSTLSPDERAALVLKEMTLDEKITLLHGTGHPGLGPMSPLSSGSNGGAGYVVGIDRLGIPGIQMSDAAYGVRSSGQNGRYSTALPCNLAAAATWDLDGAYQYGALIGRELRDQGFNMSLGGGVNLTREPRNGRNFEYLGEDPILAGTLVGRLIRGTQDQHVLGDIKHYALNNQESGRNSVNVNIDERSMRETDLLAFEIGVRDGSPAGVMCSYNRVNGEYACDDKYLLTDVLKRSWKFPGFVLSDWGAAHSIEKASTAGMDHEEPNEYFYGPRLKEAVESGKVPMSEVDDHVHRILRSMFATGVIDDPPQKGVVDVMAGFELAQRLAEQGMVLLKNDHQRLPLNASRVKSIAVIGGHADVGMVSGGGSAQVDPPGGNVIMPPGKRATMWGVAAWFPTSPLRAIRASAPNTKVDFDPGTDLDSAASLAKGAEVAIVFAWRAETEGSDAPNLSLPGNQNDLIAKVAAANPNTIVVLETGNPIAMPWLGEVSAVLEAWFAGSSGDKALANILFGDVNPSGKLPITFPKSEADLPHPTITKPDPAVQPHGPDAWRQTLEGIPAFQIKYDEGLKVGYKWYDTEKKPVLFPFGFGLSYTTYEYSNLKTTADDGMRVTFSVKNTGRRAGTEIAQIYAGLPSGTGEPPKRLVGWTKVTLKPGESKNVSVQVEPLFLSVFDAQRHAWQKPAGNYTVFVGGSSASLPLQQTVALK
ncbi:MAG TPA: glycoside hydrolase family 3 C-terminal domain-containing protein [Terriglobales bacterium]|jgi:beta-glucosidase|nr:glycoside hydrolase family 3 C-terminal domain-containing protein [Terriglobales bacterium]